MTQKSVIFQTKTALLLSSILLTPLQADSTPDIQKQVPESPAKLKMSFAPIVKKVSPAVVSIQAHQDRGKMGSSLFDDEFMSFFFGLPQSNQKRGNAGAHKGRKNMTTSMGSGVIISDKGYVVTCRHVIHGADKIKVQLSDNREFEAKIALKDEKNDLVLLKLEVPDSNGPLPFIPLGKNSSLEVGDLVLALGNPFSVGQSVTNGIISALARSVNGRVLIQTDASINPGNSGGALVDLDGELVAIPNAIVSRTGGSHGIGFAIPVSVVKPLLTAAIAGKQVEHPWDGLTVETLTSDRAESLSLKDAQGAFVTKVYEDSPSAKAGLKSGDIITQINKAKIITVEDYIMKVQDIAIGDDVNLKILSKGTEKEVTFKLSTPSRVPEPDETVLGGKNILSGTKVANLSPALALDNGLDANKSGVVVLEVVAHNPLLNHPLGLMHGDIVNDLNGTPVKSVTDLKKALKDPFKSMTIQRGNNKIQIQTNRPNHRGWRVF